MPRKYNHPLKSDELEAKKVLSYTTQDEKRQRSLHPPVGLPKLDMHIEVISLTISSEDLLCCRSKRCNDIETEWGEVEAMGRQVLECFAKLKRASEKPTTSTQQC